MRLNLFLAAGGTRRRGGESAAPGLFRRCLARLGPTWRAAPAWRITQAVSFTLFLVLFFYTCAHHGVRPEPNAAGWPSHYADNLGRREFLPAETFLALDPTANLSAALAARSGLRSLVGTGLILVACLIFVRGFCAYICPLGALIDLFDWLVGRRLGRASCRPVGWWASLRYYLLAGMLAAAACGVLLSGFLAAIPLLTRGLGAAAMSLSVGLSRGWHLVSAPSAAQVAAILLLIAVLGLGLLGPRFWCRCLCPTGALFSALAALRLTNRHVKSSCVGCGRCRAVCSFDALREDSATRPDRCTFCQACGGVCTVGAIQFAGRWERGETQPRASPSVPEFLPSRRGFLIALASGLAASFGIRRWLGASSCPHPVRPPGSVPEEDFLRICIRCGECIHACPSKVLQPMGPEQGAEGLWTPRVAADGAGCEPSCNICGRVCPTGAIRALPLEEKRVARMGLAVVDEKICLPHAGREACQLCVDQCRAAGYEAIQFRQVHMEFDEQGVPDEETGFLAPAVDSQRCVGCGLCQSRCAAINVRERRCLTRPAIAIAAGLDKEDRLWNGSYRALRAEEQRRRDELRKGTGPGASGTYLPSFLE